MVELGNLLSLKTRLDNIRFTFSFSFTGLGGSTVSSFCFIIAANRAGGALRLGFSESKDISIGMSIPKMADSNNDQNRVDFSKSSFSFNMALTTVKRHRKILKLAKGFRGRQKNCYTIAKRSVIKAQSRAFLSIDFNYTQLYWTKIEEERYAQVVDYEN